MSNETKRDVFEELLDAYDDAKSSDGNLHPTQELLDYDDRYDDAFPDDMPVIPKVVGEWIKDAKARYYDMLEAMTKWTLDQPVFDWIHDNSDTFARAWLDGVWRVEGTGEIVKLEAD